MNLTLTRYRAVEADRLFIKLSEQGLKFSDEELTLWKNYLNNFQAQDQIDSIINYNHSINEKNSLEKLLLTQKTKQDKFKL